MAQDTCSGVFFPRFHNIFGTQWLKTAQFTEFTGNFTGFTNLTPIYFFHQHAIFVSMDSSSFFKWSNEATEGFHFIQATAKPVTLTKVSWSTTSAWVRHGYIGWMGKMELFGGEDGHLTTGYFGAITGVQGNPFYEAIYRGCDPIKTWWQGSSWKDWHVLELLRYIFIERICSMADLV